MKLTAKLAIMAALAALTAALAGAFAGHAKAITIYPSPLPMVKALKPDLVVTATGTRFTVWNNGPVAAGPFKVAVSAGYQGDTCGWPIPAYSVDVAGLAAGGWKTISVDGSDTARTVTVDYLNTVAESNELNNTATIPSSPVIC
jgi:hypothetical protein